MYYKQDRINTKHRLGKTEGVVRRVFTKKPEYVSLKMEDELIRLIWSVDQSYSAGAISRAARRLRASGEFDTEDNQEIRANRQQAYIEHFRS